MLNVPIDDSIRDVFENAGHSLTDIILATAEGQPTAPSAFALFYAAYQAYLDSERQRYLDNIKYYEFQQDMCSYRISIYSHFLEKQRSIDVLKIERDAEIKDRSFEDVYENDEFNFFIKKIRRAQRNLTELTEQALEKWVPVFERDNLDPETEEGRLFLETIRASYDRIREEQLALLQTTPESKKASDFEVALKILDAQFGHLTEKKTECTTRYQELGIELSGHCERRTLELSNFLRPMLETKTAEEQAVFYREFINTYISPSLEDTEGKTLLHRALDARNSSAIKQLLQAGANPFQKPAAENGLSPLAYAIQLTEEMGDPIFLLIILKRLRERPMADKEHYLPEKGQAPFYKSKPFYDFPSIERDMAQPSGMTDEAYQEQQKQVEKNVAGWFIFSEMKEFLDERIEYYATHYVRLSYVTDPLKRLTQLAALYQRLYDCLTSRVEGVLDLNAQFDSFHNLLITMKQAEKGNDKPNTNSFFDHCLSAANETKGRIQSYQMILLDPNQSIHDVLEKERGQLERDLMTRETSLKQLGLRYDLLGQRYDRLDEEHRDAHEVTRNIILVLKTCDLDIGNDGPDPSLLNALNEPNLAKKLGYVEKAVVEKCEDLTYLKTRRVPSLEENLRDGIEVIEQQKVNLEQYSRDLAEQREQHKSDLAEQREQYERERAEQQEQYERERAEQQEFMREQREYMEYLRSQMPKRENASNDSNTTNSNEEHGGYRPSHF